MISQENIPHILKYMGGKRELLESIGMAVGEINKNVVDFCDLFAGTSIVSYAFSDTFNVVSNDIQCYSSVFSKTYFSDFSCLEEQDRIVAVILEQASEMVQRIRGLHPMYYFSYTEDMDFDTMYEIETEQMRLKDSDFNMGFSFFTQYYSGTYWSYEQCMWIDSLRAIAEKYEGTPLYYAIISSVIFAMSYCAQSTGHFAQFRTLTRNNYKSVLQYRLKSISMLFERKMRELLSISNHRKDHTFRSSSLDYVDCIATLNPNTLIYADPPYSAVHYSRFYHVLETLVLYDHPKLEYKGRYRGNRFQSPFDQKSQVAKAFERLFCAVKKQQCHLLLSYSNNALLSEDQLNEISGCCLGDNYQKTRYSRDFKHMKMGRVDEYNMDVQELLITYLKN